MMQKPNYDESIVSIAQSVMRYFGLPQTHPSLPEFDAALARKPKNVIVMLFDGMGVANLEQHLPEEAFLRRHLLRPVSSVYPPTTVAATTAIQSGMTPLEHGWLGWYLWFPGMEDNIATFLNRFENNNELYPGERLADKYMPYKDICARINDEAVGRGFFVSPFASIKTNSAGETCRKVVELCEQHKAEEGPNFIYTYWLNPDHDMHELGIGANRVRKDIERINKRVEKMCAKLEDAVVVVTADHGLVNAEYQFLYEQPELMAMLAHKPSIEARTVAFFVKPECREAFPDAFNKLYGEHFILMSREEALQDGLFGNGTPHPMAEGFMGDFLALAIDNTSLLWQPDPHPVVGIHAGMTANEMNVPFILYDTESKQ